MSQLLLATFVDFDFELARAKLLECGEDATGARPLPAASVPCEQTRSCPVTSSARSSALNSCTMCAKGARRGLCVRRAFVGMC